MWLLSYLEILSAEVYDKTFWKRQNSAYMDSSS